MGSGCTKSSSSKDSCPEKVSSNCVLYQGEPFPLFGVCTGDNVTEDLEIILTKLSELAQGEGIILSEITGNCLFVTQTLANKDKELSTLIQILFDNQCTLRELIQDIEDGVEPPFSFDLKCLVTPTNPTNNQITQALIDLTCVLKETVDEITDQLENPDNSSLISTINNLIGNFIGSKISSCPNSSIVKTGSGADTQLSMVGFVPIGGVIFYNGPSSNFDSTGLGTVAACMTNFAVCNGQNGTLDFRGWTLAGATSNVPGSNALLTNAVITGDTDTNTSIGQRKGITKVALGPLQIPNHTHTINDPGHSHTYNDNSIVGGAGNAFPLEGLKQGSGAGVSDLPETTSTNTTGITVGGITGRTNDELVSFLRHENRQPTYYGLWIQRIN